MIHRYVKQLGEVVFEAATPAQAALEAAKKKYEDTKKKDEQQYKQYTDGVTTKEQYLAWAKQLLDVEREYRMAQINAKIESGRSGGQSAEQDKPQQEGAQRPPVQTQQPTPGVGRG
jgi:hypothetical protein